MLSSRKYRIAFTGWIFSICLFPAGVFALDEPIEFDSEIVPVLTKLGCNAGACHGAASGRGGFRLSLFGSNPSFDYDSIVRESGGRRINLVDVEKSLLLMKPGGELNHGGQQLFEPDDDAGTRLANWIEQGATRRKTTRLVGLDVGESVRLVSDLKKPVPLKGFAVYPKGKRVDVTRWTRFEASDSESIQIDQETGIAKVLRRGRHLVVARFMDHVVPIEILVPEQNPAIDLSKQTSANLIDPFIYRKLEMLRINPGPVVDDERFLRRVTLDLTGRLPTAKQRESYFKNESRNRRAEWIDQLLNSEAFLDYWSLRLSRQLRLRSRERESDALKLYYRWLREQLENETGWDQVVRELVVASGDTQKNGPANFYRTTQDPRAQAEFITESLLGVRLRCANCHDHPLDRWTQDDYHGLAAILVKTQQGRVIRERKGGKVIHPGTGNVAKEKLPGETFLDLDTSDSRKLLAEWITRDSNPYFAKATVNRLWAAMFGRGLIDPVDDLRATNPASHPELLNRLSEEFIESGYDIRATLRLIANSRTYQRDVAPRHSEKMAAQYYAFASVRPLPPEVLADAIDDVLQVPTVYQGQPLMSRAVQVYDANVESETLDALGRCVNDSTCESSSATVSMGLARQLHLINGKLINSKLSAPGCRLKKMIELGRSNQQIVHSLYRDALGRSPDKREQKFWQQKLDGENADQKNRRALLEDFAWSLLTCREFVTNH